MTNASHANCSAEEAVVHKHLQSFPLQQQPFLLQLLVDTTIAQ